MHAWYSYWGKPHIDRDSSPHMYICIYVSNILPILPHVFHTLVLEIHVHPEMLRIFWYIDVLTCVIYN